MPTFERYLRGKVGKMMGWIWWEIGKSERWLQVLGLQNWIGKDKFTELGYAGTGPSLTWVGIFQVWGTISIQKGPRAQRRYLD